MPSEKVKVVPINCPNRNFTAKLRSTESWNPYLAYPTTFVSNVLAFVCLTSNEILFSMAWGSSSILIYRKSCQENEPNELLNIISFPLQNDEVKRSMMTHLSSHLKVLWELKPLGQELPGQRLQGVFSSDGYLYASYDIMKKKISIYELHDSQMVVEIDLLGSNEVVKEFGFSSTTEFFYYQISSSEWKIFDMNTLMDLRINGVCDKPQFHPNGKNICFVNSLCEFSMYCVATKSIVTESMKRIEFFKLNSKNGHAVRKYENSEKIIESKGIKPERNCIEFCYDLEMETPRHDIIHSVSNNLKYLIIASDSYVVVYEMSSVKQVIYCPFKMLNFSNKVSFTSDDMEFAYIAENNLIILGNLCTGSYKTKKSCHCFPELKSIRLAFTANNINLVIQISTKLQLYCTRQSCIIPINPDIYFDLFSTSNDKESSRITMNKQFNHIQFSSDGTMILNEIGTPDEFGNLSDRSTQVFQIWPTKNLNAYREWQRCWIVEDNQIIGFKKDKTESEVIQNINTNEILHQWKGKLCEQTSIIEISPNRKHYIFLEQQYYRNTSKNINAYVAPFLTEVGEMPHKVYFDIQRNNSTGYIHSIKFIDNAFVDVHLWGDVISESTMVFNISGELLYQNSYIGDVYSTGHSDYLGIGCKLFDFSVSPAVQAPEFPPAKYFFHRDICVGVFDCVDSGKTNYFLMDLKNRCKRKDFYQHIRRISRDSALLESDTINYISKQKLLPAFTLKNLSGMFSNNGKHFISTNNGTTCVLNLESGIVHSLHGQNLRKVHWSTDEVISLVASDGIHLLSKNVDFYNEEVPYISTIKDWKQILCHAEPLHYNLSPLHMELEYVRSDISAEQVQIYLSSVPRLHLTLDENGNSLLDTCLKRNFKSLFSLIVDKVFQDVNTVIPQFQRINFNRTIKLLTFQYHDVSVAVLQKMLVPVPNCNGNYSTRCKLKNIMFKADNTHLAFGIWKTAKNGNNEMRSFVIAVAEFLSPDGSYNAIINSGNVKALETKAMQYAIAYKWYLYGRCIHSFRLLLYLTMGILFTLSQVGRIKLHHQSFGSSAYLLAFIIVFATVFLCEEIYQIQPQPPLLRGFLFWKDSFNLFEDRFHGLKWIKPLNEFYYCCFDKPIRERHYVLTGLDNFGKRYLHLKFFVKPVRVSLSLIAWSLLLVVLYVPWIFVHYALRIAVFIFHNVYFIWEASNWDLMDILTYFALIGTSTGLLLSDLANLPSLTILSSWSMVLYSINLLNFLRPYDATGHLIRMFTQIIYDIKAFLLLQVILLFGFVFAFMILTERNDAFLGWQSLLTGFEMMLGTFERGHFTAYSSSKKINDIATYHAYVMFVLYAFIVIVVAMNLLIAIMGDSYDRIRENQVLEGRMEKARVLNALDHSYSWLLIQWHGKKKCFPRYLHVLVPVEEIDNAESEEWEGRIRTIQREINKCFGTYAKKMEEVNSTKCKRTEFEVTLADLQNEMNGKISKTHHRIQNLEEKIDRILEIMSAKHHP